MATFGLTGLEATVRAGLAVPGRVLFMQVAGSTAYGLAVEGSDVDYVGVYVAPTRAVLGLGDVLGTATTGDDAKPDATVHEVGKFAMLLLKGNPSLLETLYVADDYEAADLWEELRERRQAFLSERAVKQILGFCQGQMRRLEANGGLRRGKRGADAKWAYHMLRLVGYAESIVAGDEITVRAIGATRDRLLAVRRGEYDHSYLVAEVRRRIDAVDASKPWGLPAEGDRAFLDDWLVRVRETMGEAEMK